MNTEVLIIKEPPTALRTFVQEANTFVERQGHLVFTMNRELYARQTLLSGPGDCVFNECPAHPFAAFLGSDGHTCDSNV